MPARLRLPLALAVCAHFGVDRTTALEAMYRAIPDPGALRGYGIHFFDKELTFYNAFAANDRDSTVMIFHRLGLATGLAQLGVNRGMFEKIIDGAMADHCHKTNPREATREDYEAMLLASM